MKSKPTKITTKIKSGVSIQTKTLLLVSMFLMASMGMMAVVGVSGSLKKTFINKKQVLPKNVVSNNNLLAKSTSLADIQQKPISAKQLNKVLFNRGNLWQATVSSVSQKSTDDKQKLLGIKLSDQDKKNIATRTLKNITNKSNLPLSFDWRDQDGGLNLISEVKDQGYCGSCWAFATVGMMEGSYNTYYNKPSDFNLSEQDLISCIEPNGCNGVSTDRFDQILTQLFDNDNQPKLTTERCLKYQACDAQGNGACESGGIACSNSYSCRVNNEFSDQTLNRLPWGDIPAIKQALVNNGPVMVGMIVYEDFFMYKSGIYEHYTGYQVGGHVVLIVGYGNYDGIDYWIVKNSWGKEWGENGYFRIKMGDSSSLENLFLYSVSQPLPLESAQVDCRDNDQDGYCSWGVGKQPDTCPKCSEIQDCNDGDAQVFKKCNFDGVNLGSVSITAKPEYSEIYVRDTQTNEFIYRGSTPLTIDLNSGTREIKASRAGYNDQILSVNVVDGQTQTLHFEPNATGQFLAGWPVHANAGFAWSSPITGDMDNDGQLEVAIVDRDGNIFVYKNNGELLSGWPKYYAGYAGGNYMASVALADIDKDNFQELIVVDVSLGNSYLRVYNYDGSLNWEASIEEPWRDWSSPLVGDIDGDGSLDIIYVASHMVYAFDNNGQAKAGWPQSLVNNEYHGSNAALSDINNDGKLELVYGVQWNGNGTATYFKTYVLDYLGSVMPGWPKKIDWGPYSVSEEGASVADINNDGQKEIIINDTWAVYVYDIKGNLLPGWPLSLSWGMKELSVADINNDNNLEIVIATWGKLYAFNHLASILPGFPLDVEASGIALANIDQDKLPEIIVGDWINNLYAFNGDGSLVNNFPIITKNGLIGTPAIVDLDQDGKNEIIMSSLDGYIYALKTSGVSNNKNSWPMFQHDPYHTGSVNKYVKPVVLDPEINPMVQ